MNEQEAWEDGQSSARMLACVMLGAAIMFGAIAIVCMIVTLFQGGWGLL